MKPDVPLPPDERPLDPARRPADRRLLKKVQGNILKAHGRDFTRLVLFQFRSEKSDPTLRMIFPAALRKKFITSAYTQWRDARDAKRSKWRKHIDRPFYSVGLTQPGMDRCGYAFEEYPGSNSARFETPMHAPLELKMLGDIADVSAPLDWELQYGERVHGVWVLANDSESELEVMEAAITGFLDHYNADVVHVERGFRWKDAQDDDLSREPFGFADGLSSPEFLTGKAYRETPVWIRLPRAAVLLPQVDENDHPRQSQHAFGSFLVLRKLEQNVAAFFEFEEKLKPKLTGTAKCPFEPGALLVGRSRDGFPLATLNRHSRGPNDFDFPSDDTACPFHAHIRKSNARSVTGAPSHMPQEIRNALFPRRGMVYDDNTPRLLPEKYTSEYAAGEKLGQRVGKKSKVGLLFMGYMSSLGQFGTLQKNWFTHDNFPSADTNFNDPLLRGKSSTRDWQWQGAAMPRQMMDFVRPRGGAYFYVPSLTWLAAQRAPIAVNKK